MPELSRGSDLTLFAAFTHDISAFGKLCVALGQDLCLASRLGHVDPMSVSNEYGRLKIWGDEAKADLPALAKGSLDDTLRHDCELLDLVLGILDRLAGILDESMCFPALRPASQLS